MTNPYEHNGTCDICGAYVFSNISHCHKCGSFYRYTSFGVYFVNIVVFLLTAFVMSLYGGAPFLETFGFFWLLVITAIPASFLLNRFVRLFTKPKWREPNWKKS